MIAMRFPGPGNVLICLVLLFDHSVYARSHIDECVSRSIDQQANQELLQLECPGFFHQLWEKDLVDTMAGSLPEQFSRQQLQFLEASLHPTDKLVNLDRTALDNLLAEIYVEDQQDQGNSLWQQFLGWLKHFKPENHEPEFNWLVRFLDTITPSEKTARIIMYGAFAIIILLSGALVIRELLIAGVFSRKKFGKKPSTPVFDSKNSTSEKSLSIAEIRQLEPPKQLTCLFKAVIAYLVEQGDLPANKVLTNQELKQSLHQHHSSSDKPFSLLLEEVEPVLYGGVPASEQKLQRSWQYAQEILYSAPN